MEEMRLEFAAAAKEFVAYIDGLKKQVTGFTGEPEDKIKSIEGLFNGGKEGAAKLAALEEMDKKMKDFGVTHNRHTDLSVPVLATRWSQFGGYVEHYLASLREDAVVKAKLAQHAAEWEAKDKVENLKIQFAKMAGELNQWLSNAAGVLTLPLFAKNVADVQTAIASVSQIDADLPSKAAAREELAALWGQLTAAGVTENPLAELTVEGADAKLAKVRELAATRSKELSDELAKQEKNEQLRLAFASAAKQCDDWMQSQMNIVSNTPGDTPEAQLAELGKLGAAILTQAGLLASVRTADQALMDAGITENLHTPLTLQDIEAKWKLLSKSVEDKRSALNSTIEAKKGSSVSEEQLRELKECFAHFDKDGNGLLDKLELKACVSSMGEELKDEDAQLLLKGGDMTFARFVEFMKKRLSDTSTQEEIEKSFKLLAGERATVSDQELQQNFDAATCAYLKANMPQVSPGIYDYTKYSGQLFAH
eukprot:TRINITY_DN1431_c0_g1_i4.p1 TRINITY_DN1431_c0_g1~~TRINITY_DN1431_c0_g1_i4.p1  ORF type:complete len:512 (+),score=163.61 TRINITY_DN1431_c0_g1_i4:99-1538(+)